MSERKMLALVTHAFGGRGGIAQYNRDLLSALAAAGWAVTVLPRLCSDEFEAPRGIRQRTAIFDRVHYTVTTLSLAITERPHVIFCGHIFMASLARLAARLTGAKLVLQTHGIEAWNNPNARLRAAAETADLVLAISRYTRAKVLAWAGMPSERLVVIADTVSERFRPKQWATPKESDASHRRVLLTIARMDPAERYKGHDLVIKLLPELVAAGHDVVYVVAGEGGDRARLESVVEEVGVADRVRFIGAVPPEDLPACYAGADLFVMPSTGEGFGIAFLEAMASGTPALGLPAAGAIDALAEGELGIMANADELAGAIATCLSGKESDARALSEQTHSRFGRKVFERRVSQVFNRLMEAA